MNKILFIIVILFTICFQNILAQQAHPKIDTLRSHAFYFKFDSYIVDQEYMGNDAMLKEIDMILNSEKTNNSLDSIQVVASSSPEGNLEHNRWLARQRAKAIKSHLVWKYPNVDQSSIHTTQIDENWIGLRGLVEADLNVPSREKVLAIIDTDINSGTKKWRLAQIRGGESWRYITNNFLRKLRSGVTCIIRYKVKVAEVTEVVVDKTVAEVVESTANPETEVIPMSEHFVAELEPVIQEVKVLEKPLFAVKTNLLADALTLLNIELEVPIGDRWSISGELMIPWWRRSNSNLTMQVLSGSVAVKYWLADRSRHDVMTGWSLGVYGGGGKYDIQLFAKNGSQGVFFNAGLQVGYAHKIGQKLRLEYSANLGFLRSNYKDYTKFTDTKYGDIKVFEYPWEVKRRDWFGPTNAKVSLVWLLNYKQNMRR